jgi:hypothetical protein
VQAARGSVTRPFPETQITAACSNACPAAAMQWVHRQAKCGLCRCHADMQGRWFRSRIGGTAAGVLRCAKPPDPGKGVAGCTPGSVRKPRISRRRQPLPVVYLPGALAVGAKGPGPWEVTGLDPPRLVKVTVVEQDRVQRVGGPAHAGLEAAEVMRRAVVVRGAAAMSGTQSKDE